MKEFLVVIAAVILIGVVFTAVWISSAESVQITVSDKERVNTKDDSYYLVFAENETFKNKDILLFGKFNSSDVQGALKVGGTYKVRVIGWRIRLLSMYRNIVRIE